MYVIAAIAIINTLLILVYRAKYNKSVHVHVEMVQQQSL